MSEHLTQPERIAELEVALGDAEARVEELEAALEFEHEEVNRLRDLGFALRARVAQLEEELRLAQMHPYGAAIKDAPQ